MAPVHGSSFCSLPATTRPSIACLTGSVRRKVCMTHICSFIIGIRIAERYTALFLPLFYVEQVVDQSFHSLGNLPSSSVAKRRFRLESLSLDQSPVSQWATGWRRTDRASFSDNQFSFFCLLSSFVSFPPCLLPATHAHVKERLSLVGASSQVITRHAYIRR